MLSHRISADSTSLVCADLFLGTHSRDRVQELSTTSCANCGNYLPLRRYNVRLPTAVFCLQRGQLRLDGRRVVLGQPLLCKGSGEGRLWLDCNSCSIGRGGRAPTLWTTVGGALTQQLALTSRTLVYSAGHTIIRTSCTTAEQSVHRG
ncbi:uncharacterized protein MEPE_06178 [Melanopsichium pennsylvanicum]|uniref:Uncharacterized protein n=1 Tax=Melanopsichium pennsylvanicum TaxID=63383 RepID=A0AAJ4XSE0_9BASI|nr:uncharacterized protein MEPE_06178 [Melanopsichium pennsylvanicum]